jgi:hypothetical protein
MFAAIGTALATEWASWLLRLAVMGRLLRPGDLPLVLWTIIKWMDLIPNWIGIVLFFVWFYRAAKSTRVLGRGRMSISPGWCVGWFFVPFGNLFMPYHAMSQLVGVLNPPGTRKAPEIVWIWWGLFVARNAVRIARQQFGSGGMLASTEVPLGVLEMTLSTGAAIALFLVVRFVQREQAYWTRGKRAR